MEKVDNTISYDELLLQKAKRKRSKEFEMTKKLSAKKSKKSKIYKNYVKKMNNHSRYTLNYEDIEIEEDY